MIKNVVLCLLCTTVSNLSFAAEVSSPQPALPDIRRIITADDAKGQSYIAEDGASKAISLTPGRPGYRSVNIWRTEVSPALINAPDTIAAHTGIKPPANGSVLRIIDFPPEVKDPEALRKAISGTFTGIFKDAKFDGGKHPGMHKTSSVDYAIVLEGEIYAVMDEGETLMRTGDVMIQRGTNHAWANRSNKTARIAFVLIDAK